MKPRIDFMKVDPKAVAAMVGLEAYVDGSGLSPALLDLVKIRTSQLNGCAYCIDMHTKDARARGESEQRIYELDAWAETPFYDDRERAALAWTEALTLVGRDHVPDATFAQAREHFSEAELVALTLAIVAINGWNRICIAFRAVPGTYKARAQRAQTSAA